MNFNSRIKSGMRSQYVVLVCSTLLLGIWSLPETIALRNITLASGALASVFFLHQKKSEFFNYHAWPIYVFLGFFPWLIIHLLFLSHEFNEQFSELRSLWLRCSLAVPIGLATGFILNKNFTESKEKNSKHIHGELPISDFGDKSLIFLYIGLGGYAFISLGYLFFQWLYTSQAPQFTPNMSSNLLYSLYKAKVPFVIGGTFFLPLCFILIIRSINLHGSYFLASLGCLGITSGLFVAAFSNTKNGILIFTSSLTIFIFNLIFRFKWSHKRRKFAAAILVITIFSSLYGVTKHIEQNTAWQNILANIEVGIDIDGEKFWRDRDANSSSPLNKRGVSVDDSTYERVAWFSAGVRLLYENPLGFGLVRHSFGNLALSKWPEFYRPAIDSRGATHSGWLDLALGVGAPGILLIWVPLFVFWFRSLRPEGVWFSYTSWTIPIMCLAYLTSEANGAHFVELLFFFVAFFGGITVNKSSKTLRAQ